MNSGRDIPDKGSIEEYIEHAENWTPGSRKIFDDAMRKGDEAAVRQMLPNIPQSYAKTFAPEIDKILNGSGKKVATIF